MPGRMSAIWCCLTSKQDIDIRAIKNQLALPMTGYNTRLTNIATEQCMPGITVTSVVLALNKLEIPGRETGDFVLSILRRHYGWEEKEKEYLHEQQ